jgi:ribosome-associated protein
MDDELKGMVVTAIEAAEDKLGQDSEAFFVGDVLGIADWFIVTSGANKRQVKAIVDNVEEWLAIRHDLRPTRVEGLDSMTWVLMDYGAIVIHVFDHEVRSYYELERLWKDVPRLVR